MLLSKYMETILGDKQNVILCSISASTWRSEGLYKHHTSNLTNPMQIPKWALDKVEKRLNKPSREVTDGANNRALQEPSPLPLKLKPRVTLLYLTHKVSVKVSRRSVEGMAYRPTSKVVIQSGTYWSPPRTKTLWSATVGPYIGSSVVTSPVMMNI